MPKTKHSWRKHVRSALRLSDRLRANVAGAGALSVAGRVQLAWRITNLPRQYRIDRAHAEGVYRTWPQAGRARGVPHRQPCRPLVRMHRRAIVEAFDHLAASAGIAR